MGGKRANLDSKFQPKKCAEIYHSDDWISRLPDDILVVILSSLPLKEAARTSFLSSHWKNLWKHTLCLNFDADSVLDKIATHYKQKKLRNVERRKYINWVNRVLRFHKGLTLEEFRICFDLDKFNSKAITKWLEFAFARQVQRLELNLFEFGDFAAQPAKMYVFPEEFLSRSSSGASNNSCIPCSSTLFDFKSLRSLCMKSVDVTGEAIEFFLHNCPLLEQLIVHSSNKISKLEICGSSLALRHLEICYCFAFGASIKVSAPNLTSLIVTTLHGLLLENAPMLVQVTVTCPNADTYLNKLVPTLYCCIPQLETLTLNLFSPKKIIEQCKFPELPKLKTLVIKYWVEGDQSLMGLISFIKASPYLEEFTVQLTWDEVSRTNREVEDIASFPHKHLKVVKFEGYYGRSSDFELVKYILKNCVVLEKIIIDPVEPSSIIHTPKDSDQLDAERTARIYAKQQLEAQVPQHIKLVIL